MLIPHNPEFTVKQDTGEIYDAKMALDLARKQPKHITSAEYQANRQACLVEVPLEDSRDCIFIFLSGEAKPHQLVIATEKGETGSELTPENLRRLMIGTIRAHAKLDLYATTVALETELQTLWDAQR